MFALRSHRWRIVLAAGFSLLLVWAVVREMPSMACCPPPADFEFCCKTAPSTPVAAPVSGVKLPQRSALWLSILARQRETPPATGKDRVLVVTFVEHGELAVQLTDESLELETRFGLLKIPLQEIHSIQFRDRMLDEKKSKSETDNTERVVCTDDLVNTGDSTVAGKIRNPQLTLRTRYFGEKQVALSQLRSLEWVDVQNEPAGPILPDPGMLSGYNQRIGETFWFRITGNQHGAVYGTDLYTTDASLASTAVHAGAVQVGETAVIKVTIMPSPPQFIASWRNGISSHAYGPYTAAFRVERTNLKP